ncbi:type II secretion system protein GspD [Aureicoccus marinus]|uniref:Type II/III secretion system secretin-like domain-containing protein n=1 Tax=Aureicoccus marinus TaxID=754435 RepID=A0A2S7T6U9_9FLAO|nr:general secretion pathway protein GspD [Aureicoccus marinus]PQJ15308.1 hypothetical protein BST99_05770 [Aureicoccus marinus]
MRKIITLVFCLYMGVLFAQEQSRIAKLRAKLETLAIERPELAEDLALDTKVTNVNLANFLLALSKVHKLNLSVSNDIRNINVVNNFSNVRVNDLLLFLCKEYNLDIEITGSILAIKSYKPKAMQPGEGDFYLSFEAGANLLNLDLNEHKLEDVFRRIIEVSGKNLLFKNSLKSRPLSIYLEEVPFDLAMEKLADLNDLVYTKTREGFYLFDLESQDESKRTYLKGIRNGSHYEVLDTVNKLLSVDFRRGSIAQIIENIGADLGLNMYTATPLEQAGEVTFKSSAITFDDLLIYMFESGQYRQTAEEEPIQNNRNLRNNRTPEPELTIPEFTFKVENNTYFFGTSDQLSLRSFEVIRLMHRSVELLSDSQGYLPQRTSGRTSTGNTTYFASGPGGGALQQTGQRSINTQGNQFQDYNVAAEALINILPDELKNDLDIKVDYELNSFLVGGPDAQIEKFKAFIRQIDKPVPVVLIEVMIIEVRKSAVVETGISWGLGQEATTTTGSIFPETNLTLNGNTVNRVIGGFNGFGSLNIGKVVPEFFATIKALETNGDLRIKMTPSLTTLNGHRASLSIGETTYYVETNQNFFGSQIPTSSEVRNYRPIDAQLAINIKPLVSGDGQVTLDIKVIQSDFSSERIEDDAPPGLTSREFNSIIRMQNKDLAVLGGLEEKLKNDAGSGVPFLARVPLIKYLFSKRRREDTKQSLSILIKPTVIY